MNATRSHGAAPAAKKSSTNRAPALDGDLPGVSGFVLALREQLRAGMKKLGDFSLGDLTVEVCVGSDSVWALIRRPGRGGLALRAVYVAAGNLFCRKAERSDDEALRLEIDSPVGRHVVAFRTSGADLHRLRMTVRLTPAAPLLIPFAPRDLYPLDSDDDPLGAQGKVEAAQRGMNSGLLYFRLDEPAFGSVLYFQNLTAMNDYYRATDTKPDGAVGGEWPELGYLPPSPPQSGTPPTAPLPAGEDVVVSDAILVFRDWAADNETEMARQFLQMLGVAYQELTPPAFEYRDWVWRAERTLADLEKGSPTVVRHYGQSYVMPYLDAEYPDFMVQMSVIAALHDYGKWRGAPVAIEGKLKRGLGKFYDPAVGTTRRYLPNVGDDKDADAIDSWYFYHPLLNLGRLALDGDDEARELLLKSIDYGIRAARHFNYIWPITYDIKDFSIKTKTRDDGKFGQTDVNGIYAYVMIQLYELTDDDKYLREARAAIDAAIGKRFNLMYQANLTAWGAAACLRLWRITTEHQYLAQSYAYLASFFHNCEIWESEIGNAQHYHTFLGPTCLHDAPYMAIYECFDSFTAFEHYLSNCGPDVEPAVRLLVSEYCKYSLDRAWFYYPDILPPDALADKSRSGRIDRNLSFPLEDLYGDGQPAGQVGQEIYGCGAAFVYATRSHQLVTDAPFRIFCNEFIRSSERTGERAISLQLEGGETCTADLSVVRAGRRKLPKASLVTAAGDAVQPHATYDDRIDFRVSANGRIILTWD